ncbi:membrane protein insertion efficiency factor YidD [Mongoliibacter ruber]|uniref:Putative membrane protein insertion efficiency factor n=1 Tax=Mongoliibacter ruber TaxID=1750599 RepID=A0A2T0WI29_9BACT|nr:membrane protein insertion efficiency factor YidD [Mongoliibacter ruber]PRY86312.1 putative membrane protein insertion efficiency factor [Mongoliibacter ruber]
MRITFSTVILFLFFFSPQFTFAQEESVGNIYNFYQKYISDIRPTKCPMYPSCSNYAMSAFKNYNVFKAAVLTTDRLMRCGHEHDSYDALMMAGEYKLLDPAIHSEETKSLMLKPERLFSMSDTIPSPDLQVFKTLIDEGHFQEALYEYHRLKAAGEVSSKKDLEHNYYRALFGLGEYEKIIFHQKYGLDQSLKNDEDINLKVSEAWFKLQEYTESISFIEGAFERKTDKIFELEGLVYAFSDEYVQAMNSYNKVGASHPYHDYVQGNIQTVKKLSEIKTLNPTIAGLMGIFPGGGYLYSGHTTTGISAFVLTGLLGYATYTSFQSDNTGVGILSGIFTAAFYTGSISGGVKASKRRNTSRKNALKNKLKYSFN